MGKPLPKRVDNVTQSITTHFSINHITEPTLPLVSANCNVISTWLGIVVTRQAKGTAVVFVGVICHKRKLTNSIRVV